MIGVGRASVSSHEMAIRVKVYCWMGLVLGILAALYCLMGLAMVASFSEAPNVPAHQAAYNLRLWGGGFLVSFLKG